MWLPRDAAALRALDLEAIRRLIGATRGLPNAPSEWTGWQVINPEDERQRYAARAADGSCTRCGRCPPRPGLKLCEGCAVYAAARSRDLRARRRAAGICTQCGGLASGGHARCETCRDAIRVKVSS